MIPPTFKRTVLSQRVFCCSIRQTENRLRKTLSDDLSAGAGRLARCLKSLRELENLDIGVSLKKLVSDNSTFAKTPLGHQRKSFSNFIKTKT